MNTYGPTSVFFGAAVAATFAAGLLAAPNDANACGCFAQPNPAQPVVQAGERIVFARDGDDVVAHIQIQYEGEAEEFAWLVPVPAVPEFDVGTEELFQRLEEMTAPQFLLSRTGACGGGGPSFGCASDEVFAVAPDAPTPETPPIAVDQGSAGPFDYAVVRADEKAPMLEWLRDNRYMVAADGEGAMDPYIRPGAFFLAVKLRSGETTGSLQPIVLRYKSDFPMIPLILTSAGSIEDMGVLVWVLGDERAIPHNYQHVEINEEYVDWVNGADNYAEVVARAIDEAEGGHAFVTEYADTTEIMVGVLDPVGRFPPRSTLSGLESLRALQNALSVPAFDAEKVRAVLREVYPMPQEAVADGWTEEDYYRNLERSLSIYDPEAEIKILDIVDGVWERIVQPVVEAGRLFRDHSMMTRLYTVMSPHEMTEDPVFAFNPDLPTVPRLRSAELESTCGDNPAFILRLNDGREYELDRRDEWNERELVGVPRTRLIEVLRQEGQPEVVVDNRALLAEISDAASGGGCQSTFGNRSQVASFALMFLLVFGGRELLRRRA